MADLVVMPKYGLTMTEGTVAQWLVEEGSFVEVHTPICVIETQKVSNELETQTSGTLLKILVPEGESADVGAPIAVLGEPGEDIAPLVGEFMATSAGGADTPEEALVEVVQAVAEAVPAAASDGRIVASPSARKLAAELGVDLAAVAGTGPRGRITRDDVTAAASAPSPSARRTPLATPAAKKLAAELGLDLASVDGSGPSGRIRLEDVASAATQAPEAASQAPADPRGACKERSYAGLRRIIGERMGESLRAAAPVTYNGLADVHELRELLARLQEQMRQAGADVGDDVMTTAAVVRAAAMTLKRMPRFNSSLEGDVIRVWKRINIGVAVALSKGLIVPVVTDADRKSLAQIASEIRELAERAQENQLTRDEINGATFTVTTLGPYRSVDFFTPIINPPESAILGIGRMQDAVVAVDGAPVVRAAMDLSLTCDHRVLDGAPSAEFLEMVMDFLAEPFSLLV